MTSFKIKVEDDTKYRVTSSTRNVYKYQLHIWARLLRDQLARKIHQRFHYKYNSKMKALISCRGSPWERESKVAILQHTPITENVLTPATFPQF